VYWALYKALCRTKQYPVGRAVSSLVVMLFLVHPNIVMHMFSDLRCVDIDGDQRLFDDLEIMCWGSAHTTMTFYIALPSLLVWGLGIPFFGFLALTKTRKALDIIQNREKWGFLFNGLKKESYYWEIVIVYRKMLIIFISVYVTQFGIIAQALILFLILIIFTLVTIKKKPFNKVAF
jgi:hypothetical protein